MRPGERRRWRELAAAARVVSESVDYAEEYMAKIRFREAWAALYGIPDTAGLPRPGEQSRRIPMSSR